MKILLVHPRMEENFFAEAKLPPLGLAYVASALRRAGHTDVRILDANVSKNTESDIKRVLSEYSPDIAGVSLTTPLLKAALQTARLIKSFRQDIKIIFGGVHPTLFPKEMAQQECVDYVVFGEGEITTCELADCLQKDKEPIGTLGVAFMSGSRVVLNAPRPLIANLDTLPYPAYDLLPFSKYHDPLASHAPCTTMISSRGCPHSCIFCDTGVVLGKKYRANSAPRVFEEMMTLSRKFGIKEILFKESEFTLDQERVSELCRLLIREKAKIAWSCNGHVGRMKFSMLEEMRRAGCRVIQYGVESGDQKILDLLKKGTTTSEIIDTFQMTRKAGIKTVANLLIGNPGETRESISRTIDMTKRIRADFANIQVLSPFPGTELYQLAVQNGWFLDGLDFDGLRSDTFVMNATALTTDELRGLFKKMYRSFYLRPGYILSRFLTLNRHEWKMNFLGLLKMAGLN
jgi:anaerobic magnesium-protoporphyrin IX monomethyl ester cyclase